VPREALPPEFDADTTGLWLGAGRHVVHYPIRGGQHINVVAVIPERTGSEGWGQIGEPAVLRARFRDAAAPLASLLAVPDSWLVWSLEDRAVARPMARGHLALLGDAAHPILPFLAQGVALAIEDAAVLAKLIGPATDTSDLPAALARYSAARTGRVRRVRKAAHANGRTYHAGALVGRVRNLVMRRLGPDGMTRRYAWLYGWTP
jgi:salicylate hydroxylase